MAWWHNVWQRILALFHTRKEQPMRPEIVKHRPWTLLIYMAGDNGKAFRTASGVKKLMAEMTTAGYKDIWEMAKVGTTDACAVVCLFDTLDESYLVEVRQGVGMAGSVVQTLKEINTGHPDTLKDFVVYGIQHYPADHFALVIWNHGTGWLDVDHYASVRSTSFDYAPHQPIFRTTGRQIQAGEATRPIAFDDTSKDFLDTNDLRRALGEAAAATGRRLDILGMDACLMAMIEGADELRPYADIFVASQEVEPMDGWPYSLILAGLNETPGMAPAVLAERIVRDYAQSYGAMTRAEETVTQSATALASTVETVSLAKALVDAVLAHPDDEILRTAVRKARDAAQRFQDKNYRDLGDFAKHLADDFDLEFYPGLRGAALALYQHLEAREPGKPILQVAFRPRYAAATGLSVYLPETDPSVAQPSDERKKALEIYRGLFFPQATGWDKLLTWLDPELAWLS